MSVKLKCGKSTTKFVILWNPKGKGNSTSGVSHVYFLYLGIPGKLMPAPI